MQNHTQAYEEYYQPARAHPIKRLPCLDGNGEKDYRENSGKQEENTKSMTHEVTS